MKKKTFEWRIFLKQVAIIAIPVALQNLLTTTGSMVDTVMIAPLGETTVGAVGLCAQFSSLMFSGYWGFVGGAILFFSQYWGAKDDRGIERTFGTTFAFMMFVGIVFSVLALLMPGTVMGIYTDKTAIQEIGKDYLRVVGFAYPIQILSILISSMLRSTERVRIPLIASIASVATNLFLNWVFIYGKFGLPAMGVQGAAAATVCAAVVNLVVLYLAARKVGFVYLFHFRNHFKWSKAWMKEYLHKCFPIICNEVAIGVGNMVINMVLGRQKEEAIAAIAVFRTLEGLIIGFFSGFSNAASVLVGKCVGAGELEDAYQRGKRLIPVCGVVIAMVGVALIALRRPILTTMSLEGEAYDIGASMVLAFAFIAVIRMCNWAQNDTYRSSGDAAFGTILEIVFMYGMVLPCMICAGLVFKWPVLVVFICCYVDEPIRFVMMQVHMHSGKWIKPVTPQGKEALPQFHTEHGIHLGGKNKSCA